MRDRFSKAISELEDKNAFVCESCDDLYGHGKKEKGEGRREDRILRAEQSDEKRAREKVTLAKGIVKGDPTPFGS